MRDALGRSSVANRHNFLISLPDTLPQIVLAEALRGRDAVSLGSSFGVASSPVVLRPGQMLLPGFVDAHVHAPQFPNAGLGYDKTLLDWLQTYTFPLEARYVDQDFAARVYEAVVRRCLSAGTTLACYFATIHPESSLQLARSVVRAGQRALIGKVNMNVNNPADYNETTEQSVNDTISFVDRLQQLQSPLVQAVVTPRFAISCDMDLMKKLADLARSRNLHIQTHISENMGEIEAVRGLYQQCANYAEVYDRAGLLTSKTVLAHGVHLLEDELRVLAERGTSVAHCPTSNTCLRSGLCDVRRLLDAGVTVGLGTDVSGGPSPSILDAIRAALDTSIHVSFSKKNYKPLNYQEVFYLATMGGAKALAMDNIVGNFAVGKEFDALLVSVPDPDLHIETLDSLQQLQKFLYCGSERNIKEVYVQGRSVKKAF
ncbi:guanine deaminase [Frankliniella occidentalis]|uniref:Guanine deaminase n=1 Tax=Frankliniella occidentalis TaxID=133901 RepID=A0A9C6TNZ0_FRAOC|nr:guanine deaminase [Frankliniella occidentalis]